MTPRQRIKRFLNSPDIRGLAKTTRDTYGYALDALVRYCDSAGVRHLDKSLVDHTEAFIRFTQSTRGVSGKTIQYYCNVIRMMMAKTGSPVKGFTYRITNAEQHQYRQKQVRRWLTEEDVKRCMEFEFPNHHDRNHLIVRLLAETGCRVREIASIKVRDVNVEKRSIYIGISKTTCRHVFVNPITRDLMRRYLESKEELFEDPDRKLFNIEAPRIKALIDYMLKELGLKEPGRLTHVFRHFVATKLFYDAEMRLEDIAFLLGDSRDIIEKVYLHPTEDMLRKRVSDGLGWAN